MIIESPKIIASLSSLLEKTNLPPTSHCFEVFIAMWLFACQIKRASGTESSVNHKRICWSVTENKFPTCIGLKCFSPSPSSFNLVAHWGGFIPGTSHWPVHPAYGTPLSTWTQCWPVPTAPQPTLHGLPGQPALWCHWGLYQRLLPRLGSRCSKHMHIRAERGMKHLLALTVVTATSTLFVAWSSEFQLKSLLICTGIWNHYLKILESKLVLSTFNHI